MPMVSASFYKYLTVYTEYVDVCQLGMGAHQFSVQNNDYLQDLNDAEQDNKTARIHID